ncbi:podocalyxin-like [Saccostrea cucullata]|uniref:podocalyxin-like n=1 Tax=Saccostrea cuccullata TaxID=36930 RepID=UPI002ED29EA3
MKLWVITLLIISVTQTHGRRKDCRQCKAGHYAKRNCNELHDTICAQCPVDTYTPELNTRELCYSCSTCKEGYFVIKSCTHRHDTVCGSCDLKGYSELNSYRTKCVQKSKVIQNDQPLTTPLTSEDALEISGDGELIVDHGSLKPTVIDDVIVDKEAVTNTSQLEKDALEEGSGGFNISVASEELESSPTFTSPQPKLVSNETTTVTLNATSTVETLPTTNLETTNITSTSEPSLNITSVVDITYTEPSSSISSTSEPTTTVTPEATTISTTEPSSTTISTSSTPEPSSTTILATKPEIPEPEPTPTHKPESEQTTAEPTTEAKTTQTTTTTTTTTTQAVTTKTTKVVQTTPVPTTSTTITTTKATDVPTDGDGRIIIDLRGTTEKIIDLRTKKTTASPKPKTTPRTIDLDKDKGIVIETGLVDEDEKDKYDIPDFKLPENIIEDQSPLQPGALGSKKMDEEDGIKVGIVVAIVIGAAVIFFLIGFLVSRYCRKKRSGKFNVRNDLERGPVKENDPTALDYKDGGIYDEIGKETVIPVKNGKPNGTSHSTEDVYAVPDKRKNGEPGSPKIDDQLNKIKFIDDPEEEVEPKEGDKLLDDSDEKYSSFASIPNGSVKQNGDVAPNDYVSESSPILSSRDTQENPDVSEEAASGRENDDPEMSPLLEKTEVDESQKEASS